MIGENLQRIRATLPEHVRLVAVSKTKPVEDILEAYHAGQRDFGENKVQEMVTKKEALPGDIRWHMIGHLQTNKVKYIAPFVWLIHSVDSLKLLRTIDKEARKHDKVQEVLVEIHIAEEPSKFGFVFDDLFALLQEGEWRSLDHVRIRGVMGMATFTDDTQQVRREFAYLRSCYEKLKETFFAGDDRFTEISMGMSGDYPIAVEEGSTIVRIGTLIFGERNYL
jgi:pyridoxal phosphate enzyme (YggS family)